MAARSSARSCAAGASAIDWAFFTQLPPQDVTRDGGGLANAIVGTLVITAVAALIAIPVGFLGGVYLAEFGRNGRVATAVRMIANVVMGVPVDHRRRLRLRHPRASPCSTTRGFAGSVALAFIMLPVMARTTEDILNLVPNELRESALAMGAPRWKVTLGVVCRAARGGLITGAVARRRARRRRDRAAALHGAQQPVLADRPVRTGRLLRRPGRQPHQDDLRLLRLAVPALAGRSPGAARS